MAKIGRNARCPCGSGKKYKRCCLAAAGSAQADDLTDRYLQQIAKSVALVEVLREIVEALAFKNELLEVVFESVGELIRQRRIDEALMLCERVLDFCDEAADELEGPPMVHRARGKYVLAAELHLHACEIAGLPEQIDGFGDGEVELDREMSGGVRRLAAPGGPDDLAHAGSEG
jgi:hypothetical protein